MDIRRYRILLFAAACCLSQASFAAPAQVAANNPSVAVANLGDAAPALPGVSLHPVPGHQNAQGWLSTQFQQQRATLHTVYVAPIQVEVAADSAYKDLAPEELAALNQAFQQALVKQLPTDMQLVTTPQADSMRIEITLQRSEIKKAGFRLLNYTPVGFLVNHAKTAAGVSKVSFQGMVVAVRGFDPAGRPLLALDMKPQGVPADPGSALNPADADPNQVPMTPVRLDQMPGYLAAKTPQFRQALAALAT